jgi:3-hydroxybutyryl-CoA dehydratase
MNLDGAFTTRGRTITESDLVSFAALTGDWHPQHADASWAATGRFGQRVAHGMLLISYAIGLVDFDPERVVALRGLDGVVFKRPVAIGDTIHVEGTVEGTRELDADTALTDMSWRILNQRSETVARAKVTAVCRRDPASASENGAGSSRPDPNRLFDEVFL